MTGSEDVLIYLCAPGLHEQFMNSSSATLFHAKKLRAH